MTDKEVMQMALDWLNWFQYGTDKNGVRKLRVIEALRTALAQPEREWQGLTDAEAEQIVDDYWHDVDMFIEAIEAKLKEKNA